MKSAAILIDDGTIIPAKSIGSDEISVGEIVFNTSMTGYQEIITDPSYDRQIITFTNPHIGNTGINNDDNESNQVHSSGVVVNKFCEKPSNWRSIKSLEEFLNENDVMAISDVDTREITTILREKGALNCCIGSLSKISEKDAIKKAQEFDGLKGMDLAQVVSTKDEYLWNEGVWPENKKTRDSNMVVAYDLSLIHISEPTRPY